jgi:esterase/lipase superfamily enzyme
MSARLLRLDSRAMGRPVHVWTFGVLGQPLVVFPSNAGVAHEWQKAGMIDAVAPLLAAGRMKVYCVETNVSRSFSGKGSVHERMGHHHAYERFVLEDLVPFIRADCRSPDATMTATGCSVGALYSALFVLKHPETFSRALCLSGRYRASRLVGHGGGAATGSEDLYFNDPLAFVPNMYGAALDRVRRNAQLTLVVGRGRHEASCIPETAELGSWLRRKDIPSRVDFWGYDSAHEYAWWRKQARHYLGGMFNA